MKVTQLVDTYYKITYIWILLKGNMKSGLYRQVVDLYLQILLV